MTEFVDDLVPWPPTLAQMEAALAAVEIVRALAANEDPTVDDTTYGPAGSCGLCHQGSEDYEKMTPEDHAADCPWVLARAWVEANG